jgi:CRP/FNR family transcriptional regulator, cyclic AMP receptor protein
VAGDIQVSNWQAQGEALLRAQGWLSDIAEPLQGKLIAQGRWLRRQPGEPLAMAGDEFGGLIGIASGVVFSRAGNAPAEVAMTDLHFAPVWTISRAIVPGELRVVTIVAQTEVTALRIPQFALVQLMAEHPELVAHLFRNIANLFARMTMVLGNGQIRDGRGRCIATLLRLSDQSIQGMTPDRLPIGQQELAGMANLSRQKTGEVLRELERTGLIELGYRWIAVRDRARLEALGED